MTVLLTGAAGFIGSHVLENLLDKRVDVVCLDSFDPYYPVKIKERNFRTALSHGKAKLVRADIRDKAALGKIFRGHDFSAIIHLAAKAGVRDSLLMPDLYTDVNLTGTVNLLELARANKVQRFIFGSSSSVYGNAPHVPFKESETDLRPVSPYGSTKLAGEVLCRTYHELCGMRIACLRFFTVYGPRQRPDMAIHRFTRLIFNGESVPMFGDGSSRRDYTYYSDIVAGVVACLRAPITFNAINLGNSHMISLKGLIELIEKTVGKKAKIKRMPDQTGDVRDTCAGITTAKRLLGFKPEVRIEDGVGRFVEWYGRHRAWLEKR
jgi:UDP-glucuronate 4-epimerase